MLTSFLHFSSSTLDSFSYYEKKINKIKHNSAENAHFIAHESAIMYAGKTNSLLLFAMNVICTH